MQRHSDKRDAILDCLAGTTEHPTAEWIYAQLKPKYPNLSLATVYRNLQQFKEAGLALSVATVHGQERFDGNPVPHIHAVCTDCGRITDVMDTAISEEFVQKVQNVTGFAISGSNLLFSGICGECASRRNENG